MDELIMNERKDNLDLVNKFIDSYKNFKASNYKTIASIVKN